tara:strand:- start:16790 stop:17944 length:1155 start_codon:yes stop_codon:yes gene_type:complete
MNINNYRNAQASAMNNRSSLESSVNQRYENSIGRANSNDLASQLNEHAAVEHINMAFNTVNEGIIGKALTGKGTTFLREKLQKGVMNKVLKPAGSRIVDYAKGDATFGEDMKNLPGKLQEGLKGMDAKVQEFSKTYGQGARNAGSSTQDIVEDIGSKLKSGMSQVKDAVGRGTQYLRQQSQLGSRSLGSINGDPDAGGHIPNADDGGMGGGGGDVEMGDIAKGANDGGQADIAGGAEEAAEEGGNVVIGDAEEVAGIAGRRVAGQAMRGAVKAGADAASDAAKAAASAVSDIADIGKVVNGAEDVAKVVTTVGGVVDVADAAVPGADILTDTLTLGAAAAGFGLEKLADWIEKKTGGNLDTASSVVKAVTHSTSQAGQLMTQQA